VNVAELRSHHDALVTERDELARRLDEEALPPVTRRALDAERQRVAGLANTLWGAYSKVNAAEPAIVSLEAVATAAGAAVEALSAATEGGARGSAEVKALDAGAALAELRELRDRAGRRLALVTAERDQALARAEEVIGAAAGAAAEVAG
jgi:hypothetical protein